MADISLIIDTNADEAARGVDRLKNSTNNLTKDTKILATAQQSSGNVARTAGRKMSGTGMAIQQVGYQTGDFLVQIQGGTNAMVAFGQQATQLVGVLPMVAGNLGLSMGAAIGLSAGLGILIPLVTAVGAYFMRSGEQAKSFEDNLSDLETQVKEYAEATELSRDAMRGAREEFGYTSGVLQTIVGDLQIISRIGAFDTLGKTISTLRSEHISGFESDLENIKDLLQLGGWFSAISDEAIEFNSNLLTMEDNTASLGFRLEAALDLRQMLLDNSGGIDNMTKAQRDFFSSLVGTIQAMEILLGVGDNIENNQEVLVEGAKGFLKIWESIRDVVIEAKDAMGGGSNLSDAQYQQSLYYQAFAESMAAAPASPVKHTSTGTARPSRSTSSTPQVTPLETMVKEIALMEELRGKTEEYTYVRNKLGDTYSEFDREAVAGYEAQYAAIQDLIDLDQERASLATSIADSIGDGYTAMVEGTMSVKDAFKSMAKDIIKQLWDVLVMQRLIGSVGVGGGVGATGVAGFIGGLLGFDGGGYTGSGARSGGVDGKGGFMAMLHPQETVVDHTKGQSSGGTTVQQTLNFNFSANGDETVKKLIAQAAPQIAKMTKSSMLDDRRRGGATKAAFG